MSGSRSRLRLVALLSVAAWAVHQLRYALAFGAGDGEALRRTGHAYLDVVGPLIGLLLLTAAAQLVTVVGRRARAAGPGLPLGRSWLLLSAVLLTVFSLQELTEGALSAGHAGGLAGLAGAGGWLAVPLALVAGLVVAVALQGARAAEAAPPAVRLRGVLRWACGVPLVLIAPADRPCGRRPPHRHAGRGPPGLAPQAA